MMLRLFVYVCAIALIVGVAAVAYRHSRQASVPVIFSPSQMLAVTWQKYISEYMESGTYRVLDKDRNDVTTSEGESYAMLRAVWMDDKTTFDRSWQWTQDNLHRSSDHLFSWKWGKTASSSYGVLTSENGENSASDADTDIALSLIFAYARWQDPDYLDAARAIIPDIWNKEVILVGTTPYLAADNVEKTENGRLAAVNPSYLNPAAYRIFAKVDTAHPWSALVDSSYALLDESISAPLNTGNGMLPPDWLALDKKTGAIEAMQNGGDTNFSFDAMRVPYRLALDYAWNKDPRDAALLAKMSVLERAWQQNGKLSYSYSHDGRALTEDEAPSFYGATLGFFIVTAPTDAKKIYEQKLLSLYDPGMNSWKNPLSYYDDNWAWFGIALYNGLLPNLAAQLPASAFSK